MQTMTNNHFYQHQDQMALTVLIKDLESEHLEAFGRLPSATYVN